MISEEFQEIINKMSSSVDRNIGVIDKSMMIIASSSRVDVGKLSGLEKFDLISSQNIYKTADYTYKYFGNKNSDEFAVFISGIDSVAESFAAILSASLTHIVSYYNEKNSKISFIKNLIFNSILPGEINYKIRTLKINDVCKRVCFIVHSESDFDGGILVDALREMFPDATRDFIVDIGDSNVVLIKDVESDYSSHSLSKLANAIVCVLSSKALLKVSVGVGTVAKKISELPSSFSCAQVALEVRKVFENDKNVAMYSNLGIARLIYQLPVTLCKAYLDEIFTKCSIDDIDRDLMFTINRFFENSLNISETSRHLFVHRNTLVYRIDKIKKITGLDLRNFEDAIVFKVALMVNKYLKSSN